MLYLSYAISAGSLVCWIMTLISMFNREKIILGILGILCPLWAFIWGWMKVKETQQKTLMMAWTALIIVGIGLNFVLMGQMASST